MNLMYLAFVVNTTLNNKHTMIGKEEFMRVSGISVLWLETSSRVFRASIHAAFKFWEELIVCRDYIKIFNEGMYLKDLIICEM